MLPKISFVAQLLWEYYASILIFEINSFAVDAKIIRGLKSGDKWAQALLVEVIGN